MIHPANAEILTWEPTHPARVFLEAHTSFRREVIGFELRHPEWDVAWESPRRGGRRALSDLLYAYLSFTPVLREWMERAVEQSAGERRHLEMIAEARAELDAAEREAKGNEATQGIVQRTRAVLDAWERCVKGRVRGGEVNGSIGS